MFKLVSLVLFATVFKHCESATCDSTPKTTAGRLKKVLLCGDYDKTERPHINSTAIGFKVYLHTLSLEEHSEELTFNSWIALSYIDEKLKWNPKDYDSVDVVNVASEDLWMPDISLYNSNQGQSIESCRAVDCFLNPSGRVNCILPCTYTGRCKGDYLNWPFDRQNCTLIFGSWTKAADEISYEENRTGITTEDFHQNSKWKLISTKAIVKKEVYDCCPNDTYPSVEVNFILERHSAPYAAFLLVPALIMLALNLTALTLNSMLPERIIVCALNLCIHFMFLQQIWWYAPDNGSEIPCFVSYCRDSLVLTGLVLIASCFLRYLLYCEAEVPVYIDKVIDITAANFVGRILLSSLINDNSFVNIETDNDNANLVEAKSSVSKQNKKWRALVKLIDILLFVIFVLTYVIMLLKMIPTNDMNEADQKVISE